MVYLIGLTSFIYVTVSKLFFFFQLSLHQLNQYKKTTSFRNKPVPRHLPHDLLNHNPNHQGKTSPLTYHLHGLPKLSQRPRLHRNKMNCTKLPIVLRLPPQNYHNHQRRWDKRKITKYRANRHHQHQPPCDLPEYLNHRPHSRHQMFHKKRLVSYIFICRLRYYDIVTWCCRCVTFTRLSTKSSAKHHVKQSISCIRRIICTLET